MRYPQFDAAIPLLLALAPEGWSRIQARYRYSDGVCTMAVFSLQQDSQVWKPVSCGDFDLMNVFDDWREQTFPDERQPWNRIMLTLDRSEAVEVTFDNEARDIFSVDPDSANR